MIAAHVDNANDVDLKAIGDTYWTWTLRNVWNSIFISFYFILAWYQAPTLCKVGFQIWIHWHWSSHRAQNVQPKFHLCNIVWNWSSWLISRTIKPVDYLVLEVPGQGQHVNHRRSTEFVWNKSVLTGIGGQARNDEHWAECGLKSVSWHPALMIRVISCGVSIFWTQGPT